MTSTNLTELSIEQITAMLGFTPEQKQLEAIRLCTDTTKRLVSVTGSAGTGKTSIIKVAYHLLKNAGYEVVLAAPTGKAAKRITEATEIPAITLHRLLEYTHPGEPDPETGKVYTTSFPRRTQANPIEVDIVLCDEYSMPTQELHRNLINALRGGACVRMFGDDNQLAPIETDKRLWNTPSSFSVMLEKFPSVVLDVVHRQGKDSGILDNLQKILRGRMPAKNDEWNMVFTDNPVNTLRDLLLETDDDYSVIQNQIITPTNKSWTGTVKLNALVQSLFKKRTDPYVLIPRRAYAVNADGTKGGVAKFFIGDKVIITSNNYGLGVFNGESGTILSITADEEIEIDFGDRIQSIPPVMDVINKWGKTVQIDPRQDIDLGYAISTHKSQGSEYESVIYILNKSGMYMHNRRNLYTGCSRAKKKLTLITDQPSITTAIRKLK